MTTPRPKIIVLDDDPTGSQTVHSCLLLMQWDVETLRLGLRDDSPIFFILTNTRSLPPDQAEQVTREVCRNLSKAIALEGTSHVLMVSRSDSTLRGHYPLETDAIADELGPFDAQFLVPAFLEGGRFTRNGIHYVRSRTAEGQAVDTPVHETEFARDPVFSFRHSYLPDYVAEKTKGAIAASRVQCLTRPTLETGCFNQLLALTDNQCVAVDGESQTDLDQFAADILTAAGQGKRFLFRSAASLLTSLAQLPPQPVAPEASGQYTRDGRPGVVLVGSYVQNSTEQLQVLLKSPHVIGIEVDLQRFLTHPQTAHQDLLDNTLTKIQTAYDAEQDSVVYTSRNAITFEHTDQRIAFSQTVAALLIDIVKGLPPIGFLISKGGITSNNTLSHGLGLRTVRLLGQILPGCCLVQTEETHLSFPKLPVVLFPGNVGEPESLAIAHQRLRQH